MKKIWDWIKYVFEGLIVVMAVEEYDPELWDNPRKKERIRRKWRHADKPAERRQSGKKENG